LLVHGLWFSPGTPASSTTKTGRHDIAEILLKVALSTINHNHNSIITGKKESEVYNNLRDDIDLMNKSYMNGLH
jgi:hypothetical protein